MSREEFTCDYCEETYSKLWSDEEAEQEHQDTFGEPSDDPSVLCDDCYKKIIGTHSVKSCVFTEAESEECRLFLELLLKSELNEA